MTMKPTSQRGSANRGHAWKTAPRARTRLLRRVRIKPSSAGQSPYQGFTTDRVTSDAPYFHRAGMPPVKSPLPTATSFTPCNQDRYPKVTHCDRPQGQICSARANFPKDVHCAWDRSRLRVFDHIRGDIAHPVPSPPNCSRKEQIVMRTTTWG